MNHSLNRLQIVDTIRGLALLGILIFNIQTYALFAFLRPEQVYSLGLDKASSYIPIQFFIQFFVRGQFYTLYSFLFGFGFYMIMERNHARGWEGKQIFRRRMWTLLLFGLIHATVFWFGDVLHKYAILGFTLPYFYSKSTKHIVKWIGGIAAASVLYRVIRAVLSQPGEGGDTQEMDAVIAQVVQVWQHGSFLEVLRMQKLGVAMLWLTDVQGGFSGFAHYEIMFLLGLLAGKNQLFYRIAELKPILKTWIPRVLPIALLLKLIASVEILHLSLLPQGFHHYETLLYTLSRFIGTPLLTVGYLMLFAFLAENSSALVRWVSNAGRLGLTNYLMQTLLCMLLFYGYGFGLAGKLTQLGAVGVAFLIYAFQLVYSTIWLRYHDMGPMEGLWKRMVYQRKQR